MCCDHVLCLVFLTVCFWFGMQEHLWSDFLNVKIELEEHFYLCASCWLGVLHMLVVHNIRAVIAVCALSLSNLIYLSVFKLKLKGVLHKVDSLLVVAIFYRLYTKTNLPVSHTSHSPGTPPATTPVLSSSLLRRGQRHGSS